MPMHKSPSCPKTAFAEIIESSLASWTAQCWQWDLPPTFASLVIAEHQAAKLFGIVHHIQTGSLDPARQPFAYQKTEEELKRDQPQIFEFLQTTFTCTTVGYQENNKIFYHLPDNPVKIHTFVQPATKEQYQLFFAQEHFLHLLFNLSSQMCNLDELLLALFKQLLQKKIITSAQLEGFIETFATLCKNDYQKLKIFLQRTDFLIAQL